MRMLFRISLQALFDYSRIYGDCIEIGIEEWQ
jgi:hypothetical protein